MLSILIPIYNFDVTKLAKELNRQCELAKIDYEIVCFDDCSTKKFKTLNRALDHEFGISYIELSENLGRSKIRNKLAQNARYEHLLFLDCDSGIVGKDFISNYITILPENNIIYGGRIYKDKAPKTVHKMLHWKYGRKREALPLDKRIKRPYISFQTNNFVIKREIMINNKFDQSISGYGYEDLVFARTLKGEGHSIMHIANPILHKNIEYNDSFLAKTKLAAENLAILYHQDQLSDTRMLEFHEKVKKIGFNSLLHKIIQRNVDRIHKNLNSVNPNLRFFDLYRYQAFLTKLNDLEASSS